MAQAPAPDGKMYVSTRLSPEQYAELEAYRARGGHRSLNAAVCHLIDEAAAANASETERAAVPADDR